MSMVPSSAACCCSDSMHSGCSATPRPKCVSSCWVKFFMALLSLAANSCPASLLADLSTE
ncbi:hypothetical protein B484DRAFT_443813 [Ochromonadaceae sp. CCMP2298]|nr:hypothetical protein B484DRAFT_443813 [Ochromonadaceae sp. CCMP2298]